MVMVNFNIKAVNNLGYSNQYLNTVEKKNDKKVTDIVYDTRNTNISEGSANISKFPYCK